MREKFLVDAGNNVGGNGEKGRREKVASIKLGIHSESPYIFARQLFITIMRVLDNVKL